MVICVHFYFFLLRSNVRKGYLDDGDFRYYYGNFFESAIPKVAWSQLYLSFFSTITRHIDRHLERHPMVKDFMGMDQDAH